MTESHNKLSGNFLTRGDKHRSGALNVCKFIEFVVVATGGCYKTLLMTSNYYNVFVFVPKFPHTTEVFSQVCRKSSSKNS